MTLNLPSQVTTFFDFTKTALDQRLYQLPTWPEWALVDSTTEVATFYEGRYIWVGLIDLALEQNEIRPSEWGQISVWGYIRTSLDFSETWQGLPETYTWADYAERLDEILMAQVL